VVTEGIAALPLAVAVAALLGILAMAVPVITQVHPRLDQAVAVAVPTVILLVVLALTVAAHCFTGRVRVVLLDQEPAPDPTVAKAAVWGLL
jgi:hypothetical protein